MIRQFQPQDASACCRIIHACLENDTSYPVELRARIRAQETPQSMMERAARFYVAVCEYEDRIPGFAGLDLNEIRLLYIDPAYQRRGFGRLLLEHIMAMVPGALFPEIFVYSTVGAADFYRSCGFIDKGLFAFDLGGLSLPTIFMSMPIRDFQFLVPDAR